METAIKQTVQIQSATLDDIRMMIIRTIDKKLDPIINKDKKTHNSKGRLLSRKDVMEITGLSNSALYNRTQTGTFRSYKIGGRVLYYESELFEDIEKCRLDGVA